MDPGRPLLTRGDVVNKNVLAGVGVLMVLLGLLWGGQGMGWIGGSVMTGKTLWAVVGPLVALGGVGLVVIALRGRGEV
jgi:hypothetical protein